MNWPTVPESARDGAWRRTGSPFGLRLHRALRRAWGELVTRASGAGMKPPTGAQSTWKQVELALSPLWATWRCGEASPGPHGVFARQPEPGLQGQLRTSPPSLQGCAGLLCSWSQPYPLVQLVTTLRAVPVVLGGPSLYLPQTNPPPVARGSAFVSDSRRSHTPRPSVPHDPSSPWATSCS